jgi:FkbM family methyltransferase
MRNLVLSGISEVSRRLKDTPLGKSKALGNIHANVSLWLHRKNEAQVGEFTVAFDPRDRYIAKKLVLYGAYEKHEISLLTSLVNLGDYVLDVGANIGLYTLHLSRAVGPHGQVIAVEPDPDNLTILRKNLESNDCSNVVVIPHAFGNKHETRKLYQVDKNRGNLSFADLGKTDQSIDVEVRPGKTVLETLAKQPRVVKIDVEGAEPMVLEGLSYDPEVILFEFVPEQLEALEQNAKALLRRLEEKGYVLYLIEGDGKRNDDARSAESIYQYALKSGQDQNVLAIKVASHNK